MSERFWSRVNKDTESARTDRGRLGRRMGRAGPRRDRRAAARAPRRRGHSMNDWPDELWHQTGGENPSESRTDAFNGYCLRCGSPATPHVCLRDIDKVHDAAWEGEQ